MKFKLINAGDHVFRKELVKRGWKDKYEHCGNTAFFHDKIGDVIGYAIYDNQRCTSKKFVTMED